MVEVAVVPPAILQLCACPPLSQDGPSEQQAGCTHPQPFPREWGCIRQVKLTGRPDARTLSSSQGRMVSRPCQAWLGAQTSLS